MIASIKNAAIKNFIREARSMRRVCTLVGLFCALTSLGANRYVAPNGSDANSCSQAQPCRSVQRGIDVMQDGDTLFIADGTYTANDIDRNGCSHTHTASAYISRKDCPSGCTIRAETIDAENPRVTFTGAESGLYLKESSGWTVQGIRFDNKSGVHFCRSSEVTLTDSLIEFQQEPSRSYYAVRVDTMDGLYLRRVKAYDKHKPCHVMRLGSDSTHKAFFATNSQNVIVEDSYFGYTKQLGNLSNVHNVQFIRTQFQHWAEHGLAIQKGTSDLLFENVLWNGTTMGHCWDGANQSSLTNTQCRSDSDCAAEPGGANVCRVDDCFCVETQKVDPPYCGTCVRGPNDPWDVCWRAPRTIDVYEVDGLVVRNNNFIGHGYLPNSAIYRNFTSHNARSNCTTYPGVCEDNTSLSCNQSNGDSFCASNGGGRCIPVCEVKNYKFYNNIVYDMVTQAQMKDPAYLKIPEENPWNRHSNFNIDGNLYSGGAKMWTGCQGDQASLIRAARFTDQEEGRCWSGTLSSFTGESCTSNSDCSTNRCNMQVWQGHTCYGNPADLSGHWYPDIQSSFADYHLENYEPATSNALMVNAGINGTDIDGVRRCALTDFAGRSRADGQCDVGLFELDGDPIDDPPDDEPPEDVENLDRGDKRD